MFYDHPSNISRVRRPLSLPSPLMESKQERLKWNIELESTAPFAIKNGAHNSFVLTNYKIDFFVRQQTFDEQKNGSRYNINTRLTCWWWTLQGKKNLTLSSTGWKVEELIVVMEIVGEKKKKKYLVIANEIEWARMS